MEPKEVAQRYIEPAALSIIIDLFRLLHSLVPRRSSRDEVRLRQNDHAIDLFASVLEHQARAVRPVDDRLHSGSDSHLPNETLQPFRGQSLTVKMNLSTILVSLSARWYVDRNELSRLLRLLDRFELCHIIHVVYLQHTLDADADPQY